MFFREGMDWRIISGTNGGVWEFGALVTGYRKYWDNNF